MCNSDGMRNGSCGVWEKTYLCSDLLGNKEKCLSVMPKMKTLINFGSKNRKDTTGLLGSNLWKKKDLLFLC